MTRWERALVRMMSVMISRIVEDQDVAATPGQGAVDRGCQP